MTCPKCGSPWKSKSYNKRSECIVIFRCGTMKHFANGRVEAGDRCQKVEAKSA